MDQPLRKVKQFYKKEYGLVYINNPKAACSSIKYSLLPDPEKLHSLENFDSLETDDPITRFTVVRNPFTRVLSAYLNKAANGRHREEGGHWAETVKKAHGSMTNELTYKQFLRTIRNVSDLNDLDPHFRPQFYNVRPDRFEFDHLGYVEEIRKTAEFLERHGVSFREFSPHRQQTNEVFSTLYDMETIDLVREIYGIDFYWFRYSLNANG